jgi:quaternary ammonium compound-resistance protein SugE
MDWVILFLAGIFEIVWAAGIKYTEGFSRLVPSLVTVGAMGASILLLSIAIRTLPIGTAYAVWTGIGASGVALFGIIALEKARRRSGYFALGWLLPGSAVSNYRRSNSREARNFPRFSRAVDFAL